MYRVYRRVCVVPAPCVPPCVCCQWRSQGGVGGGGGGGGGGGVARGPCPPKLLVVNFPINLRCYVLLGCRVINVILAINIGDSAFWFNCWLQTCTLWLHMGLHCHMTKSYKAVDTLAPPNQNPGYATVCCPSPVCTAVCVLSQPRVYRRACVVPAPCVPPCVCCPSPVCTAVCVVPAPCVPPCVCCPSPVCTAMCVLSQPRVYRRVCLSQPRDDGTGRVAPRRPAGPVRRQDTQPHLRHARPAAHRRLYAVRGRANPAGPAARHRPVRLGGPAGADGQRGHRPRGRLLRLPQVRLVDSSWVELESLYNVNDLRLDSGSG